MYQCIYLLNGYGTGFLIECNMYDVSYVGWVMDHLLRQSLEIIPDILNPTLPLNNCI